MFPVADNKEYRAVQRISSDKASNLPKRDVRFILLKRRREKLGTLNKYI